MPVVLSWRNLLEKMTHLSTRKMSAGDSNLEMRELAARICRDYLHGPWKHLTAHNMIFKHISGGLSNLLYHVALPDSLVEKYQDVVKGNRQPREVLIRVYGQTHGEHALEALITESVIFTLLSERGLGPKLHGIFPGGRIEQYVDARPLKIQELANEHLSVKIAQKMASIHSMEVPLHKTASWLWNTMDRWLKTCDKRLQTDNLPQHVNFLASIDLKTELSWLRHKLEQENSLVVFCHNDMQEGNILICRSKDEEKSYADRDIVLIDFEYCSYNYRAFDVANHFIEWTYDYTEKEKPYFRAMPQNYPSEEQRLTFIRAYLNEIGSRESPKKLLKEVETFTLASHFFWFLWAVVNTKSQIPFGYWDYAAERLNAYINLKEQNPSALQGTKRKSSLE